MKKVLFIISIFILSLVCLCGCSSTSNTNTGGQVVVKKTFNEELNHYDLVSVYLKIDGSYVSFNAWYKNVSGSYQLEKQLNRYGQRTKSNCLELIQYDHYFEITLAVQLYYPETNLSLPPSVIKKKLSISNNIGSYEIEKY